MRVRWTTYILAMLFGSFTLAYSMELKDKTFNTEKAGKVVFSHSSHLKKKNARTANVGCKSCHNSNLKENVRYTMQTWTKANHAACATTEPRPLPFPDARHAIRCAR